MRLTLQCMIGIFKKYSTDCIDYKLQNLPCAIMSLCSVGLVGLSVGFLLTSGISKLMVLSSHYDSAGAKSKTTDSN